MVVYSHLYFTANCFVSTRNFLQAKNTLLWKNACQKQRIALCTIAHACKTDLFLQLNIAFSYSSTIQEKYIFAIFTNFRSDWKDGRNGLKRGCLGRSFLLTIYPLVGGPRWHKHKLWRFVGKSLQQNVSLKKLPMKKQTLDFFKEFFFLVACLRLYNLLCRSVARMVGRMVTLCFFWRF